MWERFAMSIVQKKKQLMPFSHWTKQPIRRGSPTDKRHANRTAALCVGTARQILLE